MWCQRQFQLYVNCKVCRRNKPKRRRIFSNCFICWLNWSEKSKSFFSGFHFCSCKPAYIFHYVSIKQFENRCSLLSNIIGSIYLLWSQTIQLQMESWREIYCISETFFYNFVGLTFSRIFFFVGNIVKTEYYLFIKSCFFYCKWKILTVSST